MLVCCYLVVWLQQVTSHSPPNLSLSLSFPLFWMEQKTGASSAGRAEDAVPVSPLHLLNQLGSWMRQHLFSALVLCPPSHFNPLSLSLSLLAKDKPPLKKWQTLLWAKKNTCGIPHPKYLAPKNTHTHFTYLYQPSYARLPSCGQNAQTLFFLDSKRVAFYH